MGASVCKLTLVCPRKLEAAMADVLDAVEPSIAGYTVVEARGRGPAIELSGAAERVRGAMRASMFILILPSDQARAVLRRVATDSPSSKIAYWIEPLEDFGRLS